MARSDENRSRRFGPGNDNRIDLYRALLERIQEEDQASEHLGHVLHWNDPGATWNSGELTNIWNAIGLAPVIQSLFWTLETLQGEDVEVLESLNTLVDPLACPEELLPELAASFGYRLKEDLPEETKRTIVQGLFVAYKGLGQFVGFKMFYRMVGFEIIRVFPLWKKDILEERGDYSRVRYATSPVAAEPLGVAGVQTYNTALAGSPIKPGTVRITDGSVTLRDVPTSHFPEGLREGPRGEIVGPGTETGTINYLTGELSFTLDAAAVGVPTADYETIDEEWPYHAARLDVEILMNPGGIPIPITDEEVLGDILTRMDEVRPIHVLLRANTIAFELQDTMAPLATDAVFCRQILRDVREGLPPAPGTDTTYLLDEGPRLEDGGLSIEEIVAGVTTVYRQELEDRTGFVCPLEDVLIIDTGGGSPNEGYY